MHAQNHDINAASILHSFVWNNCLLFSRRRNPKMALQITANILPLMIIMILSLASFSSRAGADLFHDHIREESGYDFRAYPFYFSTVDGNEFYNSTKVEIPTTRFSRLEKSLRTIKVDGFGAKGDGSDDTQAFQEAWKAACSSAVAVNFVVSEGKNYLLKPITFSGPCKSEITMQIHGTIDASDKISDYGTDMRHWIVFDGVQSLAVEGGGTINGNGKIWWESSCKRTTSPTCNKHAPTAVTFYKCKNLRVENLQIQDSQQMHLSFERCKNVQATNLLVTAPERSPNTDGIHVTNTQNIQISNCTIGTGDDCISIVSGSQKVQAKDIICGPGHGISIGSLGSGNSEAHVSDITVNGAELSGATNGVRIKTWQGGSGSASNIKFHNIYMHNVENPIIIDQNYCDQATPCTEQKSAVQVKNVLYQNIKGTSSSDVAIKFDCSNSFPCQGIVLQNVDLVEEGGATSKAVCNNVRWINAGAVSPLCPKSN